MKPFITFPEFFMSCFVNEGRLYSRPSVCFMRIVGKGDGVEVCVLTSERLLSSGIIIPGVAFGEL